MKQKYLDSVRWGVFTHFLANPPGDSVDEIVSAEKWNQIVDTFDVKKLAKQLSLVSADYFCITIGQNSGHYCSPNNTYDVLTGISPSKCSKRDLVLEIALELEKYDIDMWVYLPSGAPNCEPQATKALEWENGKWDESALKFTSKRLKNFQIKWEKIIKEWSLRWNDKIKAWWIDGCYFPDDMYHHKTSPNYESFANALRAGNKDAALAFNRGLEYPFELQCKYDDYTAGEIGPLLPLGIAKEKKKIYPGYLTINRDDSSEYIHKNLGNKKLHVLSHLGETWGGKNPRLPIELAVGYSKYISEKGGIITWDVGLNSDGTIPDSFIEQFKGINSALTL